MQQEIVIKIRRKDDVLRLKRGNGNGKRKSSISH